MASKLITEHPWLLRHGPQSELWCYAPIPNPVKFLSELTKIFLAKGWGQPLGFQSFSKGTDVIAIPFLNLGTNRTLEEFIAIVSLSHYSLCKGPQPLVLATRALLETAGIPHKLLQAADLDPFRNPSPETENVKLFNVGGWLIFADNAIISFQNGMPNFA